MWNLVTLYMMISTPFIASLATCVFICLEKWGAVTWAQMHAGRLGPFRDLPHCVFCVLFWLGFIICIPLIFSISFAYLVAPFAAAPMAKALYENCRAT